jgi:hypothetical protein
VRMANTDRTRPFPGRGRSGQTTAGPGFAFAGLIVSALLLWSGGALASDWDFDDGLPKLKWKRLPAGRGGFSSVAVDPSQDVHVVVTRRRASSDKMALSHIWTEGRRRRSEFILKTDGESQGFIRNPVIAIGEEGVCHVAFQLQVEGKGINFDSWLVHAVRGEEEWQLEQLELGGQDIGMAIDDDGDVHLVHTEIGNSTRYLRKTGETWESEEGPLIMGREPRVVLRDGEVHVVSSSFGAVLSTRTGPGAWTQEDLGDLETSRHPDAAVDSAGRMHVVHNQGASVILLSEGEGGWQQNTLATADTFFDIPYPNGIQSSGGDPSIVAGPGDCITVVAAVTLFKGGGSGSAFLIATFDGTTWLVDVRPGGDRGEADMGADGLLHVVSGASSVNSKRLRGFSLKGYRARLAVRPKGGGTITVDPTGVVVEKRGTEYAYPGTTLGLTATPAEGFQFVGWLRDLEGADPDADLTLDGNKRVVAVFEEAAP